MALTNVPHRIGRVSSGDVSIFYRAFGTRGATPIVIMHGANYFDSYDWIGVAGALAGGREVVAFDRRGWGRSSWSRAGLFARCPCGRRSLWWPYGMGPGDNWAIRRRPVVISALTE